MATEINSNNQKEVKDVNLEKFKFLDDGPVSEDFFGCHERIAESIAEQIESGHNGKTIGLEGTWGSGKSSIVKILEKRWGKNENFRVFTYDAWEHQGDHLRRAFLEELIATLQKFKWVETCEKVNHKIEDCLCEDNKCSKKDDCLDYIRDNLRLRYEHNVIETKPSLSQWGKWLAVATLMMPIGVAVFSATRDLLEWYFWVGLILMGISPISIAILIIRCWIIKNTDPLLEIAGKSKDTTKHTTHKNPDPTTIEFQEHYGKILSLALKKDDKRGLVIVIDNLDRVEPETALAIWGTMRTFLGKLDYKDKELINRIWVIVPYDSEAIKPLWSNDKLALYFKEKTFQIRYHVPEPLTSKWEDYFNNKLKNEAIKGQEDDTYHKIFQIFRIVALPRYNGIPTPREIKIFINRIVALALQFFIQQDVTLEEIALYVAMELDREGELKDLSGKIKDELKIKQYVGDKFREGLAAIRYGVTRSDANEVLYKPEINKAIKEGNSEKLKELTKTLATQQICNNCINDEVASVISLEELSTMSSAFSKFSKAECSLLYIKWSIGMLAGQVKNLDRNLFKINNDNWEKINAVDFIRLIEFQPEIANILTDRLSIEMTKDDLGVAPTDQINSWLDTWATVVIDILGYIRDNKTCDPTIKLRFVDPVQYVKLLNIVQTNNKDVLKYFCPKPEVKAEYLNAYLKNIKAGIITPQDIDIIDSLLEMDGFEKSDEKMVASSLIEFFHKMSETGIPNMYDILYRHRSNPNFNEQLKTVVQNNKIFPVLNRLISKAQVAALCFINIFLFDAEEFPADGLTIYNDLSAKMTDELASEIAKAIHKYELFNEICNSLMPATKEEAYWGKIIQQLVKDGNLIDDISAQNFIQDHEYVRKHLDIDEKIGGLKINYYKKLVIQLSAGGIVEDLLKEPISQIYGYAYYIIMTDKNINSLKLKEKLCKELESIETTIWLKELQNESKYYGLLDVAIELVEGGNRLNMKSKFVDALMQHAEAIIQAECEKPDFLKDSWEFLLNALTNPERKHFRKRLLDKISTLNKNISVLLEVYAKEIEIAIEEADKVAKQNFVEACIRIADDKNQEELSWMLNLFNKKPLIEQASSDHKDMLCDRLKQFLIDEYIKEQPLVGKDVIKNVADQLDITLIEDIKEEDKISKPLESILISNRFRLFYNPQMNGSKTMIFGKNGEILEGKNNNESSWRIKNELLEFIYYTGVVFSRFSYNVESGRFNNIHAKDTLQSQDPKHTTIKDQYMISEK